MITTNQFKQIVLENTPLIDVRAPIEFEKGKFLNAVNMPIMTDEERHLVGICYKKKGNEAATQLGFEMVSGEVKAKRVAQWTDFIKANPNALLYCFRGGQRSQIAQSWIKEALGYEVPRLDGGYKAFRGFLMDALEPEKQHYTPVILGGYTGAGKTVILNQLDNTIDLEAIANHRGSSFGGFITPQPTQIDFENNLAYALIQYQEKGQSHLVLENEGHRIGRSMIYKPLVEFFNSGGLVIVDQSLEKRTISIADEYVNEAQQNYREAYGNEEGMSLWEESIQKALKRIVNRLGLERYKEIADVFNNAYQGQLNTGDLLAHREWVELLLIYYYDPMYAYQLAKSEEKVVFKGNHAEVLDYLKNLK